MLILIGLCTFAKWDYFPSFPTLETFHCALWNTGPSSAKLEGPPLLRIFVVHFCSLETWLSVRTLFPCDSLSCGFPSHVPLTTGPGGAEVPRVLLAVPVQSPVHLLKSPAQTIPRPLLAVVIYFLSLLLISVILLACDPLPFSS